MNPLHLAIAIIVTLVLAASPWLVLKFRVGPALIAAVVGLGLILIW